MSPPTDRLRQLHEDAFLWALSRCGGRRADAEDVLQDVYLKILEGDATYDHESSFKTWLFSVIKHTAAGPGEGPRDPVERSTWREGVLNPPRRFSSSMDHSSAIQFPRTVTIGDLRVCFRPITPDDRNRILEGLRSMSLQTSYRRFFTPSFYPDETELRYLTEFDGEQHMAVGAVDCTREGRPGIGAARYVRLPEQPSIAEAAVVVIDAYQKQGIGSMLIAALSRYAAERGIEYFRGYVLLENKEFLNYLRSIGARNEHMSSGVVQLDIPLFARLDDIPEGPQAKKARWAWQQMAEAQRTDCDSPRP